MKKRYKACWVFIIGILFCFIFLSSILIHKLYIHEKNQDRKINDILYLLKELDGSRELACYEFMEKCQGGEYNFLAIGNSITKHQVCEFWWDEIGMAASSEENDYFHQVTTELEKQYGDVNSFSYNFSSWEMSASDRNRTLSLLEEVVNPYLDLVVIQLGENINNTDTLETDFKNLIDYIKSASPKAEILVIGNFWENEKVDGIKEKAAFEKGVLYISLKEIQGKREYQSSVGNTVYDKEGNSHKIEEKGVARHPGDVGMDYIAQQIIRNLEE